MFGDTRVVISVATQGCYSDFIVKRNLRLPVSSLMGDVKRTFLGVEQRKHLGAKK